VTKHAIVKELVHIEKILLDAKMYSTSGETDKCLVNAISKIVELGQSMFPDIVRLAKKYNDPMM
jgi:hypothetical protein